jgi:hypothetical protein
MKGLERKLEHYSQHNQPIFTIGRTGGDVSEYKVQFTVDQMALIYDALNDYPQWNDDEDDNPTSVIMSKLYNLLEY